MGINPEVKRFLDTLQNPPMKVRIPEIVGGLLLAHYGDLPVAAIGAAVFLHGMAASGDNPSLTGQQSNVGGEI